MEIRMSETELEYFMFLLGEIPFQEAEWAEQRTEIESDLERRGLLEMDFDGNIAPADDIRKMMTAAFSAEKEIILNRKEAGKKASKEAHYFVEGNKVYSIVRDEDGKVIICDDAVIKEILSFPATEGLAEKEAYTISLSQLKNAYEKKENGGSEAVSGCLKGYGLPETLAEIVAGVADGKTDVTGIRFKGNTKQGETSEFLNFLSGKQMVRMEYIDRSDAEVSVAYQIVCSEDVRKMITETAERFGIATELLG